MPQQVRCKLDNSRGRQSKRPLGQMEFAHHGGDAIPVNAATQLISDSRARAVAAVDDARTGIC